MQQPAEDKGRRRPRVAVVGAGFAGVGAVRRLVQGGLTDVILVEAGERPGGRIQTQAVEGSFVELGGQYLHGESEIFRYAQRQGLLKEEEEEEEEQQVLDTVLVYQNHTFRTPDGTALKAKDVRHNLQLLEDLLEEQAKAKKEEGYSDVTVSAGQYLQRLYPDYMARMVGDNKVKAAMIKWLELWSVLDCAAPVHDLSLPGMIRYVYEEGSGVQETKTGMWDVLNHMLQEVLPPVHLLLNKPVKRVVWKDIANAGIPTTNNNVTESDRVSCDGCSEDPQSNSVSDDVNRDQPSTGLQGTDVTLESDFKVTLECQDGDVIRADHVIVTPSMGYLKEHPEFFAPPLPAKHREAVDTMGFGNVAKVFLLWDVDWEELQAACCMCQADPTEEWQRRMLGSDVEGIALLWPDDAQVHIESAQSPLRTSEGRQWYEEVCLIELIVSYGPCLVAWVGAESAVIMESLPESEVKDVLYEILVKFLGKPDLTPPSRIIRSKWHQNPYTRGAYSYLPTGVPLDRQDHLSHPLPSAQDPVVQLAGEACSTRFYSTAHGALYSGRDAANVLLQHHNLLH